MIIYSNENYSKEIVLFIHLITKVTLLIMLTIANLVFLFSDEFDTSIIREIEKAMGLGESNKQFCLRK